MTNVARFEMSFNPIMSGFTTPYLRMTSLLKSLSSGYFSDCASAHALSAKNVSTVTPSTDWRPYEIKGKPGDPRRRPPQVAPYHLRLDWLMWFAALSPAYAEPWLPRLAAKLLEGDEPTLRLLGRRGNPFPDAPPAFVRARLFRYRYTTRAERRTDGAWWVRTEIGIYLPPVRRAPEATAGRP